MQMLSVLSLRTMIDSGVVVGSEKKARHKATLHFDIYVQEKENVKEALQILTRDSATGLTQRMTNLDETCCKYFFFSLFR